MRVLIRHMETRGAGRESTRSVFSGDEATIGRGTDQAIQLSDRRIPLNHSRITLSDGRLRITAVGNYSFLLNDKSSRTATLKPGDVIDIIGHRITVMLGDEDVDVTFEVEEQEAAGHKLRDRFTTRLWQLRKPVRPASWLLFTVILAIGLGIPASGFIFGFDRLRSSSLPDDSMWLAGKLHSTHAFMGNDCSNCHTLPGKSVRDEDCLVCHTSVNHHIDAAQGTAEFRATHRCSDCHWEHSELDSIVRTDQGGCTGCHEQMVDAEKQFYDLKPATDFLTDHPPFRLSIATWLEDHELWETRRIDPTAELPVENSHLVFSHALHLDPGGIDSPDGEVVMQCEDCHSVAKGDHISQVTMEEHCSSCHQLTFDPTTPDRVVPHGSAPELMTLLREYYALQFIDGGNTLVEAIAPPQRREARRPGHHDRDALLITGKKREWTGDDLALLTDEARTYINASVDSAAENLFERQTCVLCHDVTRVDDADVPWRVLPVSLNNHWFPKATFSHDSHKNMQCDSCHIADVSTQAADVLMPDIDSCRTCHGGEHASGLLQSTCTTCHDFHLDSRRPMAAGLTLPDKNDEGRGERFNGALPSTGRR